MRILLILASLSGNTRELARSITTHCQHAGHTVDWIDTDGDPAQLISSQLRQLGHGWYTLYLFGTWTDNAGLTPFEMKRFIAELVGVIGKPTHVAVFGTGETQWGEDYYCGAVHRIARFFNSQFPRLCIEQMPHGQRHAKEIADWIGRVLAHIEHTHDDEDSSSPQP